MKQDEIIELANKAELCQCIWIDDEGPEIASLVTFSKLVAAKERDRMCEQCKWSKYENATCNEANQSKILGEG